MKFLTPAIKQRKTCSSKLKWSARWAMTSHARAATHRCNDFRWCSPCIRSPRRTSRADLGCCCPSTATLGWWSWCCCSRGTPCSHRSPQFSDTGAASPSFSPNRIRWRALGNRRTNSAICSRRPSHTRYQWCQCNLCSRSTPCLSLERRKCSSSVTKNAQDNQWRGRKSSERA